MNICDPDWLFYCQYYKDLYQTDIRTPMKALQHFSKAGHAEGRHCSYQHLSKSIYKHVKMDFIQIPTISISDNGETLTINLLNQCKSKLIKSIKDNFKPSVKHLIINCILEPYSTYVKSKLNDKCYMTESFVITEVQKILKHANLSQITYGIISNGYKMEDGNCIYDSIKFNVN